MKTILVIIGGSGTGKTTVAAELEKRGYTRLVTTTTRPIRIKQGEVNHESYHFVTRDAFFKLDRLEENEYAGNMYGLTKNEVDDNLLKYDKLVVVMDVNGAIAMKRIYGDLVKVTFLTVSPETMEKRLRDRGDSESNIKIRLKHAYDYNEFEKPVVADIKVDNLVLETTLEAVQMQ